MTSIPKSPTLLAALLATLVLACTVASGSAHADSTREGLVLGGGLGPGLVNLSPSDAQSESYLGLSTDLSLGYGLSKQLVVYGMSRIVWFDLEGELSFSETAGAGLSYFLNDSAPSLYVAGGVGAAVFVQPASDSENQFGVAGLAGLGYEASAHWLAEVDVAYGNPGDFSSTTLMAKLNYYYY